jgi:sugar O-acyltransferase (sialic acid O-acetyltransferase NeuD family)
MKKVIIFGTGDFGKVVHFYLTHDSKYEIAAFTANKHTIKEKKIFELPIVPFEGIELVYSPEKYDMFIAVPYTGMNKIRAKIFDEAKSKGYHLLSYVNSKAITWGDLDIGENCFILENNVIQPFVKIGNDVIIWSGNHIGHHSTIADHCFIASHVVISGKVTIGPYCFLGVNSTIRDGTNIAKECVIGAGAVILKNTQEKEVYTVDSTKLLSVKSDSLKHL